MTEKSVQQIIDHWHIGRLRHFSKVDNYYEILTEQGDFLLFPLYDPKRITPQGVTKRREEILAVLCRLSEQGLDYQIMQCGNKRDVHVAHVDDWHFALYRQE